ncbi:hypothetical protein ACMBCM_07235 [Spiroplasma sp. K1]
MENIDEKANTQIGIKSLLLLLLLLLFRVTSTNIWTDVLML